MSDTRKVNEVDDDLHDIAYSALESKVEQLTAENSELKQLVKNYIKAHRDRT